MAGLAEPPPAGPPLGSDLNPLSPERAAAIFADMRGQRHIPFDFPQSYCSARAHEMRRLMALQGVECRKVFYEATMGNSLRAEHPVQGTITWSYHVAPTVAVQTPQGVVRMVIDPSLFGEPVTIERWQAAMDGSAVLVERDGAIYQPFDARDDDYSQTARLLEEARLAAESGGLAREEAARRAAEAVPPPFVSPAPPAVVDETLEDGIVPDENSAEDDDDVERTA